MLVILQDLRKNTTKKINALKLERWFDEKQIEMLIDFRVNHITSSCRRYKAFPCRR